MWLTATDAALLQSGDICRRRGGRDTDDCMDRLTPKMLSIGAWRVNAVTGEISRPGETQRLDVRAMRLLVCLADRAGQVVSSDELLSEVWAGVAVSQDSVYQVITSLRRLLRDDSKNPTYIETVPRLGYRLVASCSPWRDAAEHDSIPGFEPASEIAAGSGPGPDPHLSEILRRDAALTPAAPAAAESQIAGNNALASPALLWAGVAIVCLVIMGAFAFHERFTRNGLAAAPASSPSPARSVAVIPFLDLTEGMKDEEFADGITEELIDKISKVPGVQVPPPTSSFYFKNKQIPLAGIAAALHVAYVLDGSLRKSGTWIRVDVRLVRADSGYVVWSQTYDQPKSDILTIQDDIAQKVAIALRNSIAATANQNATQKD
jgi:transcriptional activator of cad operon